MKAPTITRTLYALCCLCLATRVCCVFGSPASALREYKAGNYDQALKEYDHLLERNSDDARLHFNAGAAAYRNKQFDEAAKQFNAALAAPDLKLQQSAYYNHGNTLFRLGEANPDPAKRTESWEKALKDYELSMKLNGQDPDAKFNHEYVKKMLEELKQQQQQQQKQDKSDQKQDQNQQNQQQQGQQNQQQQNQNQNQQQQQQQAQQQDPQEQQQQQQQQAQQQQQQQQKEQQQAQAQQANQKEDDKDREAYAAGQMTPQQAEQLMDAQKGDEQVLQMKPEGKPVDTSRPFKDW